MCTVQGKKPLRFSDSFCFNPCLLLSHPDALVPEKRLEVAVVRDGVRIGRRRRRLDLRDQQQQGHHHEDAQKTVPVRVHCSACKWKKQFPNKLPRFFLNLLKILRTKISLRARTNLMGCCWNVTGQIFAKTEPSNFSDLEILSNWTMNKKLAWFFFSSTGLRFSSAIENRRNCALRVCYERIQA